MHINEALESSHNLVNHVTTALAKSEIVTSNGSEEDAVTRKKTVI